MRTYWIKRKYEYWPVWLLFLPLLPLYFIHALRLKSLVYFTWVNPGIEYGGFFGESKDEILKHVPSRFKPASIFIPKGKDFEKIKHELNKSNVQFPIIYKPNIGERGNGVKKIPSLLDLERHIKEMNEDCLVQEFIDSELEFGVFYTRIPGEKKGKITSITGKKFMHIQGDGNSSIENLMTKKDRFFLQIKRLRKGNINLKKIVPNGEKILLEPIGNHCLGTEFTNCNHLINEKVNALFDEISKDFEGFYYGRYDLKVKELSDLETGKGLSIFELNGVASEPGHIYDSNYTLVNVYRDLVSHWFLFFKIAKKQKEKGITPFKTKEVLKAALSHLFKKA